MASSSSPAVASSRRGGARLGLVLALAAAFPAAAQAPAQCRAGTVYLTIDTGWGREAEQIAAILRRHGVRATLFVANEPAAVLADPRVVRSGVSDPRAGLSAAEWAEGWVRADDLKALRRTHLLRRAEGAYRVVLHVADELPPSPVPLLLLAADLVDHQGARELARARELIRGSLA